MSDGNLSTSELVVGKKISVKTTTTNEVFEGIIYGVDHQQNCLALFELKAVNSTRQSFRMFNLSYLEDIKPLPDSDDTPIGEHFKPKAELPKIPTDKLKQRVEAQRAERKEKIGKDVTIEAQDVYDCIEKTLPCKWEKDEIVIFDNVILPPPYTPEHLTRKKGSQEERANATLEQAKKILTDRLRKEGERKAKGN